MSNACLSRLPDIVIVTKENERREREREREGGSLGKLIGIAMRIVLLRDPACRARAIFEGDSFALGSGNVTAASFLFHGRLRPNWAIIRFTVVFCRSA